MEFRSNPLVSSGVTFISIHESSKSSLISIASFQVITGHQEAVGSEPTGLFFNKMMSILNKELKMKGIDLGLPHCWYRWGDEVVRYLMPGAIKWNHEEPQHTKVSWKGKAPLGMGNDTASKIIIEMVEALTANYAGEEGINKAIADVYRFAPFEFQRKFRSCREAFASKVRSGIDISNYGKDFLWPLVNEAMESFPVDDFPEVADQIKPFKELMRILLNDDGVDYRYANEVSEEFWTWFCYYLRLHPSCHENVSRETLSFWNEKLAWEDERYLRQFSDHVVKAGRSGHKLSTLLDRIAAVREQEIVTEDQMFDGIEDDLHGLDDFLSSVKQGYRTG